MNHYMHEIL